MCVDTEDINSPGYARNPVESRYRTGSAAVIVRTPLCRAIFVEALVLGSVSHAHVSKALFRMFLERVTDSTAGANEDQSRFVVTNQEKTRVRKTKIMVESCI